MIIFLHGPDTFRSKEKLKSLKDKFIKQVDKSGLNLIDLEAPKISIDDFNKAISTPSFLSKKRMIVLKDVFRQTKNFQNEVLELLKKGKFRNSSETNVLIFWDEKPDKRSSLFKYLNGSKFKEEFNILENRDLINWIVKRVQIKGGKISRQNANLLASKSDGNLWALAGEIEKLVAIKQGQEMTREDIEQSSLVKINDNIFNLTDAVANKNKQLALKLINDQLESGINEIYLLTMIARQFRILLQVNNELVKGQINNRSIAKDLGLHPFVVQKAIPQAQRYSLEQLKEIYQRLLEIDLKLKTSQVSAKSLLEVFVLEI